MTTPLTLRALPTRLTCALCCRLSALAAQAGNNRASADERFSIGRAGNVPPICRIGSALFVRDVSRNAKLSPKQQEIVERLCTQYLEGVRHERSDERKAGGFAKEGEHRAKRVSRPRAAVQCGSRTRCARLHAATARRQRSNRRSNGEDRPGALLRPSASDNLSPRSAIFRDAGQAVDLDHVHAKPQRDKKLLDTSGRHRIRTTSLVTFAFRPPRTLAITSTSFATNTSCAQSCWPRTRASGAPTRGNRTSRRRCSTKSNVDSIRFVRFTDATEAIYPAATNLMALAKTDPVIFEIDNLLGNRFLCKEGGMLEVAPSGIWKEQCGRAARRRVVAWTTGIRHQTVTTAAHPDNPSGERRRRPCRDGTRDLRSSESH